eukprot:scaffold184562_cov31-Tisochrysis_lutea.AAC.2
MQKALMSEIVTQEIFASGQGARNSLCSSLRLRTRTIMPYPRTFGAARGPSQTSNRLTRPGPTLPSSGSRRVADPAGGEIWVSFGRSASLWRARPQHGKAPFTRAAAAAVHKANGYSSAKDRIEQVRA